MVEGLSDYGADVRQGAVRALEVLRDRLRAEPTGQAPRGDWHHGFPHAQAESPGATVRLASEIRSLVGGLFPGDRERAAREQARFEVPAPFAGQWPPFGTPGTEIGRADRVRLAAVLDAFLDEMRDPSRKRVPRVSPEIDGLMGEIRTLAAAGTAPLLCAAGLAAVAAMIRDRVPAQGPGRYPTAYHTMDNGMQPQRPMGDAVADLRVRGLVQPGDEAAVAWISEPRSTPTPDMARRALAAFDRILSRLAVPAYGVGHNRDAMARSMAGDY